MSSDYDDDDDDDDCEYIIYGNLLEPIQEGKSCWKLNKLIYVPWVLFVIGFRQAWI